MSIVLDASVAVAWAFADERNDYTAAVERRLRADIAWVPWLWRYEVANALLIAERRKRIDRRRADEHLGDLAMLNIAVNSLAPNFDGTLELARRHQRTVYDALYLELAIRRRLPLATLDRGLRQACAEAGVAVFEP